MSTWTPPWARVGDKWLCAVDPLACPGHDDEHGECRWPEPNPPRQARHLAPMQAAEEARRQELFRWFDSWAS